MGLRRAGAALMKTYLARTGDIVYIAVVFAICAGLIISVGTVLLPELPQVKTLVPRPVSVAAAIAAVLLTNVLAEQLLPLRALSQHRWVYHAKLTRTMSGIDHYSLLQLGVVTVGAAAIGIALNFWWQLGTIAAVSRILFGMRNWRLAELLTAGRTRDVGLGGISIQDSELVSNAIAATVITQTPKWWRKQTPTANYLLLAFRRLYRRFYLPLIALAILLYTIALAAGMPQLSCFGFLLGWGIVGAGIARAASFGALTTTAAHRVRRLFIALHTLLAVGILLALWQPHGLLPAIICAAISVGWIATARSKPRTVTNFVVMDSGFGFSISPDVASYYLAGLVAGVTFAALAAWSL